MLPAADPLALALPTTLLLTLVDEQSTGVDAPFSGRKLFVWDALRCSVGKVSLHRLDEGAIRISYDLNCFGRTMFPAVMSISLWS